MEDLLDFDDAAAYPFGLSNNPVCAATSVSCLENNHSVQSTVKASTSTLPASNSPPPLPLAPNPGCDALRDWITKSQMQLVRFQRPWLKQYAGMLSIVPLCTGYWRIGVSSDLLYLRRLQKAKIMVDNSLCYTDGSKKKKSSPDDVLIDGSIVSLCSLKIIALFIIPLWIC